MKNVIKTVTEKGMIVRSKQSCFIILFVIILFLWVLPLPLYAARSPQSVYTIQIASLRDMQTANKHFDAITRKLVEKNLEYLRIEKIGKYYSLRLGKFGDRASAEKFLKTTKSQLPSAIVMDAYYKEERIMRIYEHPRQLREKAVRKPVSRETPEKREVSKKIEQRADLRREPVSLKEQLITVASLVDKKDFNTALKIIKKETAERPDNPELNAWHGTVLLKMDKPAEALNYLKKASELSPGVSDYHNGVGYCLFFLNRYDKAIDEFNKALALEPQHIDALTGLSIAYAKNGNKDKAIDIYYMLKGLDRDTAEKLLKIIEGGTS
jgi:tetratricopeptide (TPR) repeat protein